MKTLKTKSIQKLLKVNQHKKITLGLTRTQKALGHINLEKKTKSKILTINGTSAKFSILNIFKKYLSVIKILLLEPIPHILNQS